MDRRELLFSGAAALASTSRALAAPASRFAALERQIGGRLGLFGENPLARRKVAYRASERFRLCSTFKVLAAAAVLDLVDQGRANLDQRLAYGRADLLAYAPVAREHLEEGGLTLRALCEAAVCLSDNTAANLILRKLGGPAALTKWLRERGDSVTRLDRWEPALNDGPLSDLRDTTSPEAMADIVGYLLFGNGMSPESAHQLLVWMRDCKTGASKIRAGAPGWIVGDKTGNNGHDACGDVAVLQHSPDGPPIMLSIYVAQATVNSAGQDAAIAEATRIALAALSAAHG